MSETEGAAEAGAEENVSALEDNIRSKGSNAYYYAHGSREGVEKVEWDGKPEPRLLRRMPTEDSTAPSSTAITTYGWYDDGAKVKIFTEMAGVEELEEDQVTLESDDRSLTLTINASDETHVLRLSPLKAAIESARCRVKPGKVWITLRKEDADETWRELLSKDD